MLDSVEHESMRSGYESDITRFLRELKKKNPDIERGQREGRAIFWDKNIDADLYKRYEASEVPQPGYVYGSKLPPSEAK